MKLTTKPIVEMVQGQRQWESMMGPETDPIHMGSYITTEMTVQCSGESVLGRIGYSYRKK